MKKKYKVIIFDIENNKLRIATIKSNYKIENFKRKIERYFGRKNI